MNIFFVTVEGRYYAKVATDVNLARILENEIDFTGNVTEFTRQLSEEGYIELKTNDLVIYKVELEAE